MQFQQLIKRRSQPLPAVGLPPQRHRAALDHNHRYDSNRSTSHVQPHHEILLMVSSLQLFFVTLSSELEKLKLLTP